MWPESTAEVSRIVALCAANDIPVIPFGAGTSVEGHVSAPYGGICIDLSRMNAVLAVHPEDGDCVVQPGVTRGNLNSYLRDTGLFFPVDPGADASIGGMVSTRASGTTTVRYGGMPQQVLALEVVLADGRVVRCGTRARKSSAGYDLVRMFIGSEGTLGIVTEITLRLHGRPESVGGLTAAFPTMREAVETVTAISLLGIGVARIEFLDEVQVRACNAYSKLELPESPMLFMEFHGIGSAIDEQIARAREIAEANGGTVIGGATHRRRARTAVEGAPCGLLRRAVAAARLPGHDRRRVRADQRARGLRHRDARSRRRRRVAGAHPRARRRRQLPRDLPARSRVDGRARPGRRRLRRPDRARAARRRHLHRRARHRLRQAPEAAARSRRRAPSI